MTHRPICILNITLCWRFLLHVVCYTAVYRVYSWSSVDIRIDSTATPSAITDFACTTAQAGRRVTNLTTDRLNEFPHQQHSFIDHLKLIANQCQLLSSHNSNVTFLAVQLLDLVSHVKFGVWKWVTIHSNAAVYRNHSMTTVSSMTLESLTTHIRQTDRQRDRQTDRQTLTTHIRQTERQIDRQIDRQTGRQTLTTHIRHRQTDRQRRVSVKCLQVLLFAWA